MPAPSDHRPSESRCRERPRKTIVAAAIIENARCRHHSIPMSRHDIGIRPRPYGLIVGIYEFALQIVYVCFVNCFAFQSSNASMRRNLQFAQRRDQARRCGIAMAIKRAQVNVAHAQRL